MLASVDRAQLISTFIGGVLFSLSVPPACALVRRVIGRGPGIP